MIVFYIEAMPIWFQVRPKSARLTRISVSSRTSPEPRTRTVAGNVTAAGTPNPRIAAELVVSLDTVKKHVSHLLGKLGAANRTEAVTRARQLGLIP